MNSCDCDDCTGPIGFIDNYRVDPMAAVLRYVMYRILEVEVSQLMARGHRKFIRQLMEEDEQEV